MPLGLLPGFPVSKFGVGGVIERVSIWIVWRFRRNFQSLIQSLTGFRYESRVMSGPGLSPDVVRGARKLNQMNSKQPTTMPLSATLKVGQR